MEFNRCRLILDSVGEEGLLDLVSEFLDLLETSVTVYEKNEDYALHACISPWCRALDEASLKLCGTEDTEAALSSGKWLYHELRRKVARKVVEAGQAIQTDTHSGISVYAVPIHSGGEVIGSISCSFGDPPTDPDKLREISAKFQIGLEELRRLAESYNSRPRFIIELAKQRLHTSARLIGEIVERKQAENALRESEERYRSVTQTAADGIIIADHRGKIVSWNYGAWKIFDYAEDEILGQPLTRLMPERYKKEHNKRFKQAITSGKLKLVGKSLELIGLRKDGAEFPLELSLSIWQSSTGVLFTAIIRDITERKRAEETLKHAEKRFRELFDNMSSGVAMYSAVDNGKNFIFADFNKASERIDKVKKQDVIGKKVTGVFPGVKKMGLFDVFQRVWRTGVPEKTPALLYKDKNLEAWRENFVYKLPTGEVVAVYDDITKRINAERALRESEERYRMLFDSAGDAIFVLDIKGRFLDVNEVTCQRLGYSREELFGLTPRDIDSPESAARVPERLEKIRQQKQFSFETEQVDRQGKIIPTEVNARIIEYKGRPAILSLCRDITERKKAEETLRESEERLRLVLSGARLGWWDWDIKKSRSSRSQSWADMLGYTLEEAQEAGLYNKIVHPEDFQRTIKIVEEHLQGLSPYYEFEVRLRRKTGEYIWVLSRGQVMERDKEGVPLRVSGTLHNITERKKAEEALRESEENYRELYDNAPVGYQELDRKGIIVRINRTGAEMLGYAVEEMAGRLYLEFVAPDEKEAALKSLRKNMSKRMTLDPKERRLVRKNGTIIDVLIEVRQIFDEKGRITGSLATLHDITDRKRAEQALADEAVRRRILIEESRDGIVVLDTNGKVYEANKRYSEMLGYTPEEVLQLHAWDWDTQFPREQLLEMIRQVDSEGDHFETRHHRKDGTYYDVEISTNGALCGGRKLVFCVCRDITARKRAEEGRRLLETAFEQTAEAVIITDPEGNIIYTNPAFERATGYSRPEALGQNPSLLKSGRHEERFYKELWETITSGQVWKGRLINKRKDGSLYTEEATISPVKDAASRITNFVAVKRDITQELELENQLRQAQKMESIGLLAGGVAHDFNNILTTVLGYSSMMARDQGLSEKYRKRAGEIEKAAQRGADIAKQLLTFSRKRPPKLEPVDLNEIIKQSLNFLKRTIGPAIPIDTAPGQNLHLIEADSTQVQQILLNLAVNARDAMPGGGKIVIRTENIELDPHYIQNHIYAKPGSYVLLTFSDSGCGMDSETQKRIFEPFFTTKEVGKGTGLGLSVVYGIVKNHLGLINVYSEPGRGTTFKVYFPRSAGSAREAVKDEARVKGGTETVLVVDDEVMILNLVASILEDYGYKCLTAESGAKALELYQEQQSGIALVLLDIVMPRMGGPELFEKLKGLNPGVRVIMSSGFSVQDEDELASRGVKAFVPKPYQARLLARKIREVLDCKD